MRRVREGKKEVWVDLVIGKGVYIFTCNECTRYADTLLEEVLPIL